MAGFTLLELLFVVVIAGLLARYAVMKWTDPAVLTMAGQAQAVAAMVRQAQNLAMTRGERMGVTVTTSGVNGVLSVACTTAPCATDSRFTLTNRVALSSAAALFFGSQGTPINADGSARTTDLTYTLSFTPASGAAPTPHTVTVRRLTGTVVVAPT